MIGDPFASPTGATSVLTAMLEARTGQQIAANRAWRIETSLKPLLRARGFASLDELVSAMIADTSGGLAEAAVDALLNQETSFFRDAGVLEAVAAIVGEMERDIAPRTPRIWSAACSTGQEPLSLAMLFAEREAKSFPEIVATDISEPALARARSGRFTQFEIQRGLPVRRMIRWFDAQGADWFAKPELLRRISWRRHNLVAEAPPPGRFDIILCRNALLYFAPQVRRDVLARLATAIRPGGVLVLGAGETVIGQSDAFQPSRRAKGFYEPAGVEFPGRRAG